MEATLQVVHHLLSEKWEEESKLGGFMFHPCSLWGNGFKKLWCNPTMK